MAQNEWLWLCHIVFPSFIVIIIIPIKQGCPIRLMSLFLSLRWSQKRSQHIISWERFIETLYHDVKCSIILLEILVLNRAVLTLFVSAISSNDLYIKMVSFLNTRNKSHCFHHHRICGQYCSFVFRPPLMALYLTRSFVLYVRQRLFYLYPHRIF